jgi:hypothetical protein
MHLLIMKLIPLRIDRSLEPLAIATDGLVYVTENGVVVLLFLYNGYYILMMEQSKS